MATSLEIREVKTNTDEASSDNFDDTFISDTIDEVGVSAASALIWRKKAATYASLVNVNEGGSSRSFSDLHKNALSMAKSFDDRVTVEVLAISKAPKVKKIIRK